jgi:orotidine-5'-phosphate decarboxylase
MSTDASLSPRERLIVALDVATLEEAVALAARLEGHVGWFKVGLELFVAHGPAAVAAIAAHGPVFLDLKLHDIPTTVARAVGSAVRLDVGLLTVHTGGGSAMMRAAREAAGDTVRLLGVTVLTSTSDAELSELGSDPASAQVPRLAALARDAGIDGLVCAPTDLGSVRAATGPTTLLVTPGIRATPSAADDHARSLSAPQALAAGADLLVIGRPITRAQDPVAAADAIAASLA